MWTCVGAVIMAAEVYRRKLGVNTRLPSERGFTITRCVKRLLRSGIEEISVVVGRDQMDISAALSGYPVCIVVGDPLPGDDPLKMLDMGIQALPGYVTGVIVTHCHEPMSQLEDCGLLEQFHHMAPQYAVLPGQSFLVDYPALLPVQHEGTALLEKGVRLGWQR